LIWINDRFPDRYSVWRMSSAHKPSSWKWWRSVRRTVAFPLLVLVAANAPFLCCESLAATTHGAGTSSQSFMLSHDSMAPAATEGSQDESCPAFEQIQGIASQLPGITIDRPTLVPIAHLTLPGGLWLASDKSAANSGFPPWMAQRSVPPLYLRTSRILT
jgi:hypothetical protein